MKTNKGPAFTDPSKVFRMDEKWLKRPIKYEKWAEGADIAVSLEQDVYQAIYPLIAKYAKENRLKIAVKEGTCGIAAGMLAAKSVDIGGFCCPPGREDRLPGLKFHTLGIVGKAFIVHPENPVENLSLAQLEDIYAGKIYRWSKLNDPSGKPGPSWPVRPVGRLHCQTRPGHWRLLLDNEDLFSPRLQEIGTIQDMISKVAASKEAIGWEVLGMIERYKGMGRVKILKINGYLPNDPLALAYLKYPFYRTYGITTWQGGGFENPRAKKLAEYLMREFDGIPPEKYGFVSAKRLKRAGWKFSGEELIGEPKGE